MGLKVVQILSQSGNKISRMQKYASQPSAMPISSLSKSAQQALSDLLGITIGKKGRTTSEQLQHLNQTWTKSLKSGSFEGQQNRLTQFKNIEFYTKQGKTTQYLKIGNDLYYIPKDSHEYKAFEFADNLYNKFLGQVRNADKKGHFGFGFNKNDYFSAYKYIEADATIADYPNLLKEGFGLDCLLSTPISAKSIIVKNRQAIRIENGLVKYIGHVGGSYGIKYPEELITQEVKISKFFEPESEAYEIVKNYTEKDISSSLKKLNKINENDLAIAHSKTSNIIDGDYKRIEEQLKLRREYLLNYAEQIEKHPKKDTELMLNYLQRIESYLPKQKEITAPVDKFLIYTETDAVLKPVEDNWQAFKRISKHKFVNSSTEILEDGTYTHNAMIENLESILDNGLTTGQATLATKMVSGSNVGGNYTSTPAQLDTFIVKGKQSIKEYFTPYNRHKYENGFMQHNKKVCYTIDKTRIRDFYKIFNLRMETGLKDLKTHYTIPFGVPASCIDRIIVRSDLSQNEINNIIKQIEKRGLDIKLYNRDGKLLYDAKNAMSSFDDIVHTFRFEQFGKNGLPLKYSRADFRNDIWTLIDREVPISERTAFLARFNLTAGVNGVLDGVPIIKDFVPKTQTEKKMLSLIEKFYQNETIIASAREKHCIDSILKKYPEFNMMVGKVQHGRQAYSVDIHSLKVIQNAMNNPAYEILSEEGKEVLKLTALMHDFGKMGGVVTPGHAKLSKEIAERVLNAHNVSTQIKNRVLNQIDNHHWFEKFNKREMSLEELAKTFSNPEDRIIACMIAKGDFESVNPTFHLERLTGTMLTVEEYEQVFNQKMKNITRFLPLFD